MAHTIGADMIRAFVRWVREDKWERLEASVAGLTSLMTSSSAGSLPDPRQR
jgi:hypothetical protein